MAENDATCLPLIIYYMREKFFRHAVNTAVENLKLYNNDPALCFFKAFGTLMEGDTQEAMRELRDLQKQPRLSLCSTAALIDAHRRSETIDEETLNELTSDLRQSGSVAGDSELYYAALLYWILGYNVKARTCINKILKLSETSAQGLVLKGWIILTSDIEENRSQAIRYFDEAVQNTGNVFGLMGKAEFFMLKQNEQAALDIVNQVIVSHPDFIPALGLKMKIYMSLCDWVQTEELAHRILERDELDLKALQMVTVIAAAKDGNMRLVKERLQALMNAVETSEPNNSSLHVKITAPISRLCGHSTEMLKMLTAFVQRAVSRSPAASDVVCELGYLLSLQNKYKVAHNCYSAALTTPLQSPTALTGVIRCLLMCGQLDEAAQHLTFLCEVQESFGNTAEVFLLKAMLARKQRAGEEIVEQLLKNAVERHLSSLRGLSYSVEYLQILDLNFLLQIVCMHMELNQDLGPGVPGQTHPFWLKHSDVILETLIRAAPGVSVSCCHLAHVKFLLGDIRAAQHLLNLCMGKEPSMPEADLLQARLHLHAGDLSRCLSCLESAVSIDFQVQNQFQFSLIKGRALLRSGDLKTAIQCLNTTMKMRGVCRPAEGLQSSVSISERVSVYLELTEALRLNGEQHEATKVLQDAKMHFKGTSEETRVTLASVDLALTRDDVDAAILILQNILPHDSMYIQTREKMAHIYLEKKRSKKLYIQCYREMHDQMPGAHTSVLLGDAFMKIQQPEEAVQIYRVAERTAPKDTTIVKKTGHALVTAHEYDKAVSYYETALMVDEHNCLLSLELAELLFKLQEFEKAHQVLQKALEHEHPVALAAMMNEVKILRVLGKVLRAMDESALNTVKKAHDLQLKILNRLTNEEPAQLEDQRKLLANICCDWGDELRLRNNLQMSRQHYTDALNYRPNDEEVIFNLAQLYYEHQKLDHSEEKCLQILQLHQNHPAAALLLADTLFWKNQKENGVKIYTDIMERHPDHFNAMYKFLHALRRLGNLDDAQSVFKSCEKFCPLSVKEPGYNYCKGLYFWHVHQVTEALNHLNKARGDSEWGEKAVELMVQICLNPDKDILGGEVLGKRQTDMSESERQTGFSTAQNLLMMFHTRFRSEEHKVKLLQNTCLIYSREPKQVERGVLELTDMMSKNVMLEASLLVAAQGLLQLKQIPRARNFLKRLTKMEWNDANADVLENASLLMADMYIKMGKNSHVDKLLDSCIRRNKSCSKAYEYQGFLMEKEQRFSDASLQYELAWRYSCRVDPAIGFRLAFSCLKCRNYTRAVDVCRQVLQQYPDYPQIRDEVLTRAQISLRL